MTIRERIALRRLRREYAAFRAEGDRAFWAIHDQLGKQPDGRDDFRGKGRLRRALDIYKTGEEYQTEKALSLRIGLLEGRFTLAARETQTDAGGTCPKCEFPGCAGGCDSWPFTKWWMAV